ncbi:MAG TPA: hypothetical protein VGG75_42335 [Trebonia sp.]
MSPLGWPEVLRPYAGERWWVLALPLAVFVAGACLAFAVSARRDLGAGVLSDRPGRPSAAFWLRGPLSLAWRLQRAALLWWAVGFAFIFGVSGAVGNGIGSLAFGLVPRACAAVGWTAFAVPLVLSLFGQTLKLSHWVLDVSPFTHPPRLPGGPVAAAPLIWLPAIFLALAGLGLAGLRRRDIG